MKEEIIDNKIYVFKILAEINASSTTELLSKYASEVFKLIFRKLKAFMASHTFILLSENFE